MSDPTKHAAAMLNLLTDDIFAAFEHRIGQAQREVLLDMADWIDLEDEHYTIRPSQIADELRKRAAKLTGGT